MAKSIMDSIRSAFIDWLMKESDPIRAFPLSDFERILYEIRPCDVLLIEGRSRVSNVIRMITQSTWTHSALYIGRIFDIPDKKLREIVLEHYSGDPEDSQLIIESLLGQGIVVSPLTKYNQDHIRICRPKGIARQDAEKVIRYAIERLGKHYAVREIFDLARFLFPWGIFPRRWRSSLFAHTTSGSAQESCSSLIAEAFQAVEFPILPVFKHDEMMGVELIQRNPRLYTPSDFDYSPFFEIIKYPIIELSNPAAYRNLPWNRDGTLSDDDGRLYTPRLEKKTEIGEKKSEGTTEKKSPKTWDFFD